MTASARGPRVLLSAYQCAPEGGSVSQIGWEWYARLARRLPTTLVTHVRNRAALAVAGAPVGTSEVLFVDTEWFAAPLYRIARRCFPRGEHAVFLVSSLDFFVFDRAVVRMLARRARGPAGWDIVHAVTPVSPSAATRLHRLRLPVVLGPRNGGLGTPEAFRTLLRAEASWLYPVRNASRLLDAAIGSTRHAAAILCATRATVAAVPARHRERCHRLGENGVDLERFPATPWPAPPSPTSPLRVLFVGRLVPVKGVPMLLEAIARMRADVPVELTIVGDGPMAGPWRAEAERLGVTACVRFAGPATLDGVAAAMAAAHVLCLPSVRESGGAVLLEAMAAARPVIAIAYGGPAEIVDDGVGRAIPPDGAAQVTAALEDALRDVAREPEAWRRRGEEGRRRAVGEHAWEAKVTTAIRLYRTLLADRATREEPHRG